MSGTARELLLLLDTTLSLATALVFTALAGLLALRAGMVDLSLEGRVLGAGTAALALASATGSWLAGLGAAVVTSVALAALFASAALLGRGDVVLAGIAVTLSALTLISLLPDMPQTATAAEGLPAAPDVLLQPRGKALAAPEILGRGVLMLLAVLALLATALLLVRSRFGLTLRAAGDGPEAAALAGIAVAAVRGRTLLLCGLLTGSAGASLAFALGDGPGEGLLPGTGYLALAAVLAANARVGRVLPLCLFFALIQAVGLHPVVGAAGALPTATAAGLAHLLALLLLAVLVPRAVTSPRQGGEARGP